MFTIFKTFIVYAFAVILGDEARKVGLINGTWGIHVLFLLILGAMVVDRFSGDQRSSESTCEQPRREPCYHCNSSGAGINSPGVGMHDGDPMDDFHCSACGGTGWIEP